MKFFSWVFSATRRHRGLINKYENGKVGIRIFLIVLTTLLLGASLAAEWWFASTLKNIGNDTSNYPILKLIGIGLLWFLAVAFTADFSSVFCYVAFRTALFGVVATVASKIDEHNKANESQLESGEQFFDDNEQQKPERVCPYKWLDILVGVYQAAILIALVVVSIVMFSNFMQNA